MDALPPGDVAAGFGGRVDVISGLGRCALFALLVLVCACSDSERGPAPNLLLITLDTTRADHCSVHGYERDTTPELRSLAEQGTRFDRAYAPSPSTAPTHASIFTSLHPLEHGLVKNGLRLDDRFDTLAERLARRGYETRAFVSSFVLNRKFGFAQGFDAYDDKFETSDASLRVDRWEGFTVLGGFDRAADETTTRANRWLIHRERERPFFLFVHYFDPHNPYDPPEPFASRFRGEGPKGSVDEIVSRYDGEIAFADAQIGRLLETIDHLGIAENTLIVVTGDHGEGLSQHGQMYHGVEVYEEAVRIPLVFRWPGRILPMRVIEAPMQLNDLTPTLLDLLEIPRTDLEGRTLAPALVGDADLDAEHPLYFQTDRAISSQRFRYLDSTVGSDWTIGERFGIRRGRWKYIEDWGRESQELFDLAEDPGELRNLATELPGRTAELSRWLREWRGSDTAAPAASARMTEEDIARLRVLGYVR
jgi:arylsulfatase A-like enzyme